MAPWDDGVEEPLSSFSPSPSLLLLLAELDAAEGVGTLLPLPLLPPLPFCLLGHADAAAAAATQGPTALSTPVAALHAPVAAAGEMIDVSVTADMRDASSVDSAVSSIIIMPSSLTPRPVELRRGDGVETATGTLASTCCCC